MNIDLFQKRVRIAAISSWGLMAFFLPFSTAFTLLFSSFGVALGLLGLDRTTLKQALCHPISILAITLFSWLLVSTLWSVAPYDELIEGVSKYRKLLYVPLVAMLILTTKVKPSFVLRFFIAGCVIVYLGSLLSTCGFWDYIIGPQLPQGGWWLGGTADKHWFYIGPPDFPTFGRAYIAQGAFLVFAFIYLVGILSHMYLDSESHSPSRLRFLSLMFLFMSGLFTVVVNLGGRTGYLLIVLGMILWLLKFLQSGQWSLSVKVLFPFVLLGWLVLAANPRVIERATQVVDDVARYHQSYASTGQGVRLGFWESGLRAGLERPVLGWGVGSYAEMFSRDERQPVELRQSRAQPHSEYVLQLTQGGVPALVMTVGFIGWALRKSWQIQISSRLESNVRMAIIFIFVLFFVDGLFNSVIWDLGEGHFFSLLAGTLVAVDTQLESAT